MKKLLLLSTIVLMLLLSGCVKKTTPSPTPLLEPGLEPTPGFDDLATPTPDAFDPLNPISSITPDVEAGPTISASECSTENECVSGNAPFFCLNGKLLDFCQKCGCPGEKTCGRQDAVSNYHCFFESEKLASFENASILPSSETPSPEAPSPTPTPVPVYPFCNSSFNYSGSIEFEEKISYAYSSIFNNSLRFDVSSEKTKVFYYVSGNQENQVYLTLGNVFYPGIGENQLYAFSQNNSCKVPILVQETGTSEKPFKYSFKMLCFNNYTIDARISERLPPGDSPSFTGKMFADKLADVCS